MVCPSINELFDFARRLLSVENAQAVHTHLQKGCAACSDQVDWLAQVVNVAAHDRSFAFPEEQVKGLVAWFKAQPAHASRSLRQLVAELLFDSLNSVQLAQVRDNSVMQPALASGRQMLFRTDGFDIDLRFESRNDLISEDLIGQVLPQSEAFTKATVVLTRKVDDLKSHRVAQTDEQGLFRFARLPSGVYDVTIRVAEAEIKLPNVMTAYCY